MLTPTLSMGALIAAVGTGLIGGVFFAFSNFVMKALARLPTSQGIAAMQHINVTVLNPWFLSVFMGTAVLCFGLVLLTLLQGKRSAYVVIGATLYVLGTFVVTMTCNVPKNNVLAALASDAATAGTYWTYYLDRWTMWNHVRTAAALLSSVFFVLARSA